MDDLGYEKIKHGKRNWIGKSLGTDVDFKLQKDNKIISTFIVSKLVFIVTFIVLARRHELINESDNKEYEKVKNYIKNSAKSSEAEKLQLKEEKTMNNWEVMQ